MFDAIDSDYEAQEKVSHASCAQFLLYSCCDFSLALSASSTVSGKVHMNTCQSKLLCCSMQGSTAILSLNVCIICLCFVNDSVDLLQSESLSQMPFWTMNQMPCRVLISSLFHLVWLMCDFAPWHPPNSPHPTSCPLLV